MREQALTTFFRDKNNALGENGQRGESSRRHRGASPSAVVITVLGTYFPGLSVIISLDLAALK
jgi:hypothetical protein